MASYRIAASNVARPGRLNAAFVRTNSRPGVYGDQHGLRLRVYKSRKRQSISKQWIWRGTVNGARRDIGLGGFPYVTLAEARQTAFEYRKTARAGGDPVTLRRRPDVPTFAQAAETVIAIHREGWKDGGKSESQWRASLRDYALPRLGRKGVDEITTADVMAVLISHWHAKTETMRRVRQRIGAVMKWAVRARIFMDDIRRCVPDGEINVAISEGIIVVDDVAGEIGAVIFGTQEGRRDDAKVTLFDSTGMAIPDSATVTLEYQCAAEAGVGIEKKMIST